MSVTITADSVEEVIAQAAYEYLNPRSTDSDAAHLIDHIYGALGQREEELAVGLERFEPLRLAVERAMNRLRLQGYRCEQDWQCCMTCGWDAIPWRDADQAVWYHRQDLDHALRGEPLEFVWTGDAQVIREALEVEGLVVEHDGSITKRIRVGLPPDE